MRLLLALLISVVAVGVVRAGIESGETFNVRAGANIGRSDVEGKHTWSSMTYYPASVTINVGDTVSWSVYSIEPHTVSFVQTEAAALNLSPFAPPFGGNTLSDPSGQIYSGLLYRGEPAFNITFQGTGSYFYACSIHPGMTGWVHVVDSDSSEATSSYTEEEIRALIVEDEKLTRQYDIALALEPFFPPQPPSYANDDGTRTWINRMGQAEANSRGDGMLEYFRFTPSVFEIARGDSVLFYFGSTHALAFAANVNLLYGLGLGWLGQPVSESGINFVPRTRPNEQVNSGILPFGASFTVRFGEVGVFPFICSLHLQSGMNGTVTVKSQLPRPHWCENGYYSEKAKTCKDCNAECSVCDGPGVFVGAGGCLECNEDNGYWLSSDGRSCVTQCAIDETLVFNGLVWQCQVPPST